MSAKRTRESNRNSHLSPDVIAAIGSSAARRSLDKTSPEKDLPLNGAVTPVVPTRSSRKLKSPQDESFQDPNTYGTRSNGKKRVIDSVEAPQPPPAKRGRGRPSKNKTPRHTSFTLDDEEAAYDARMALRGSEPPETTEGDLLTGVRIEGDLVYGPGTLIRHINHLSYTENKQPAAMGAALTLLDVNKRRDFDLKYHQNGEPIIGSLGEQLRNIPDVPDKVSTELADTWYQVLLQDMCGATYTDLLHRLNAKLPASKFSNRIMNYRLRRAKFSISPNDREISKGSLMVAAKLSLDQVKYNTCWTLNTTKTKMRQPERKDPEGWMPVPNPAGDFDTSNHYIKDVLAELNRCRTDGLRKNMDWVMVFENAQRAKKANRRRASRGNYADDDEEDTYNFLEGMSDARSSSLPTSSITDEDQGEVEETAEEDIAAPEESPTAATMSLDSMVRKMIGDSVADIKQQTTSVRGGPGIRQASRMDTDIKSLKGEVSALKKEKTALAKELTEVRKSCRDLEKWAKEAIRDLKSDLEVSKWRA